ncbi:MAG: hypothetical protein KAR12_14750 [Methylococcales bacterium]|nr:hypothetical protein [Methylococcales bacterium]
MEENYLISLFVFFLFGFVLFKKDSKKSSYPANSKRPSVKERASNVSGVARYLQDKQDDLSQSKLTGVSRYLESKEEQGSENLVVVSGVAKYLATKEEVPVSGVSKYMARQSIQAKKTAKENVSGVEKYLNNRS